MLIRLNEIPLGIVIGGVIIPKSPPCFAIPFFEGPRLPLESSSDLPRDVLIQDVFNSESTDFAKITLDPSVRTISAKYIQTVSLESGDYDWAGILLAPFIIWHKLVGQQRLYAFAESLRSVRVGTKEPLRKLLSHIPMLQANRDGADLYTDSESECTQFTLLELARFQRSRQMCIDGIAFLLPPAGTAKRRVGCAMAENDEG